MGVVETRYAKTIDGVHIAYQVLGSGPPDVVLVRGFVSHLEHEWTHPAPARYFRRLSSFSRLIRLDKRGTGLSDRVPDDALPDLETRMDDLRAVMDAAGCSSAVLIGESEGAPLCALFAATYPERTRALILIGGYARVAWAPDFPIGVPQEELERENAMVGERWGTPGFSEELASDITPSLAADAAYRAWFAALQRYGASPSAALAMERMANEIDVRAALPAVRVPTLVLHSKEEINAPFSLDLAARIPGATVDELPGSDHTAWGAFDEGVLDRIEGFVLSLTDEIDLNRVLATVMFTDIVGSTNLAADLGDRAWSELVSEHHGRVRAQLARFHGTEVDTAGDGFLASFDGPARAVRCASAIVRSVRELGIQVRAGLHCGECELVDGKVRGIAVHTGARVASLAGPGEILVSQTVRDLVAGSGLVFEDAGEHELRGVPDRRHLYRVVG